MPTQISCPEARGSFTESTGLRQWEAVFFSAMFSGRARTTLRVRQGRRGRSRRKPPPALPLIHAILAGMLLGAHESVAGGAWNAIARGREDGCEALQIFARPS